MSRWEGRVREQLLDGESVVESFDAGVAHVVVTDDRVLVFTPTSTDGPGVQTARRSNVSVIRRGSTGSRRYLWRAALFGVLGLPSVVIGTVFEVADYVPSPASLDAEGAGRFGASDLLSFIKTVLWGVIRLDEVLLVLGVVFLLAAIVALVYFWTSERSQTLELLVTGEAENIVFPRPPDSDEVERKLERLLDVDTDRSAPTTGDDDGDGSRGSGLDDL